MTLALSPISTGLTAVKTEGNTIRYTPSSAVAAGDVVVINGNAYVAKRDIAANRLGELTKLRERPHWVGPKATGVTFADRAAVYWDASAVKLTSVSTGNTFMGYAVANTDYGTGTAGAYASGDTYMEIEGEYASTINNASSLGAWVAKTAAGSVIANATALGAGAYAVSGGNNAVGVGLVSGQASKVKNLGSGGLFVYPPVGGTINALSANSALNMATVTVATFIPTAANSLVFYTDPLLPS